MHLVNPNYCDELKKRLIAWNQYFFCLLYYLRGITHRIGYVSYEYKGCCMSDVKKACLEEFAVGQSFTTIDVVGDANGVKFSEVPGNAQPMLPSRLG